MSAADYQDKAVDNLKKELKDLFREQFNLRMQKGMGESPKPHLYKKVRRDIARIKTIINQKERQA